MLAEKVPGGQSLHPVSACTPVAEEYVPAGQSSHVAAASALEESLHFPAPHKAHSVLSSLLYVPALHAVQLAPAVVLTWPASQSWQTRAPMFPDICLPAGHIPQTVFPVALLVNFPISQCVHVACFKLVFTVSLLHLVHMRGLTLYMPAPHGVHRKLPVVGDAVPFSHSLQIKKAGPLL
jgi:hypothetical protein